MLHDANLYKHMRPQDVRVFAAAARTLHVIIGVRRTNPASLPYIGQWGFIPKRIVCKAKTAEKDVVFMDSFGHIRRSRVAGLVVDPTLPVMRQAFSPNKLAAALKEWDWFMQALGVRSLQHDPVSRDLVKYPVELGGYYTVQSDPTQERYGCVQFFSGLHIHQLRSTDAKLSGYRAHCIHADYDLYCLVKPENPSRRESMTGTLLGVKHFWSPLFHAVQNFVNNQIGLPMVRHGSQEHLSHKDDTIDVFWPNGEISTHSGAEAIRELYAQRFGNRQPGML